MRYAIGSAVISACLLLGTTGPSIAQAASSQSKSGAAVKTADVKASKTYAQSTVDRLNVRTSPKLTASVIQMIGKSGSYEVLDKQGEWLKIQLSEKQTGWVSAEYIKQTTKGSTSGAIAAVVKTSTEPSVVKITDVTNLRKGPSTEDEIVGKAQPGETYPILSKEGDWYRISRGAKGTAYVAAWVVSTNSTSTVKAASSASGRQVYIYHTHNRESWKNVATQTKGSSIDDPKVNITLVGDRLGTALQKRGISAFTAEDDITERLAEKNLSFSQSYTESRKIVQTAMKSNASLGYFFDIHRDGDVPRKQTTVTIGGKTYARVLFVIGMGNADYKANKQFAEALSERLEKKYPGLSRGVLMKDKAHGDGEYNQSLSPNSMLLEFGGANNTLQEALNTADAFGDIFAAYVGASKLSI
ncbi:stage II sporulation protein P [Cohnella hashimotonis]|uniref:Stage II sporulation protein P n=1 Tax=Cohnella hashimotonis TaxID=2826895 RepID=A0ABT6TME4_9BACL|nr:stage II sporulation protein P [Cohnella hashimotonis]MDI4647981.1 stage II sporulation protein P [Cohnella hashimotonis]